MVDCGGGSRETGQQVLLLLVVVLLLVVQQGNPTGLHAARLHEAGASTVYAEQQL